MNKIKLLTNDISIKAHLCIHSHLFVTLMSFCGCAHESVFTFDTLHLWALVMIWVFACCVALCVVLTITLVAIYRITPVIMTVTITGTTVYFWILGPSEVTGNTLLTLITWQNIMKNNYLQYYSKYLILFINFFM